MRVCVASISWKWPENRFCWCKHQLPCVTLKTVICIPFAYSPWITFDVTDWCNLSQNVIYIWPTKSSASTAQDEGRNWNAAIFCFQHEVAAHLHVIVFLWLRGRVSTKFSCSPQEQRGRAGGLRGWYPHKSQSTTDLSFIDRCTSVQWKYSRMSISVCSSVERCIMR